MSTVRPTVCDFVEWYDRFKMKECTKDFARQMVGFNKTAWYKLCRDYENGEDISKYFSKEDHNYG